MVKLIDRHLCLVDTDDSDDSIDSDNSNDSNSK